MACTSAGKPVVAGQATWTTAGKPGDLARYSAALDLPTWGRQCHCRQKQGHLPFSSGPMDQILLSKSLASCLSPLSRYGAKCPG